MPRYTNAQFLAAIKGSGGLVSIVAETLGCAWNTANDRIQKNEKLMQAFINEMEQVDDLAESKIIKSIKEGNTQDAKWWLARRRKDKFSERNEITGADGGGIPVTVVEIVKSYDGDSDD